MCCGEAVGPISAPAMHVRGGLQRSGGGENRPAMRRPLPLQSEVDSRGHHQRLHPQEKDGNHCPGAAQGRGQMGDSPSFPICSHICFHNLTASDDDDYPDYRFTVRTADGRIG